MWGGWGYLSIPKVHNRSAKHFPQFHLFACQGVEPLAFFCWSLGCSWRHPVLLSWRMVQRTRCCSELSICPICTTGALHARTSQSLSKCLKRRVTKETRYTRGWEQSEPVRTRPQSQNFHSCWIRNSLQIRSCNLIKNCGCSVSSLKATSTGKATRPRCVAIGPR